MEKENRHRIRKEIKETIKDEEDEEKAEKEDEEKEKSKFYGSEKWHRWHLIVEGNKQKPVHKRWNKDYKNRK